MPGASARQVVGDPDRGVAGVGDDDVVRRRAPRRGRAISRSGRIGAASESQQRRALRRRCALAPSAMLRSSAGRGCAPLAEVAAGERVPPAPRASSLASPTQPQRFVVAADLRAVDVEMDEAGAPAATAPGIGAVLVGAVADQQDDVGLLDQRRRWRAMPPGAHEVADDAERQRMAFVDGALAHGRGRDRQAAALLQRAPARRARPRDARRRRRSPAGARPSASSSAAASMLRRIGDRRGRADSGRAARCAPLGGARLGAPIRSYGHEQHRRARAAAGRRRRRPCRHSRRSGRRLCDPPHPLRSSRRTAARWSSSWKALRSTFARGDVLHQRDDRHRCGLRPRPARGTSSVAAGPFCAVTTPTCARCAHSRPP